MTLVAALRGITSTISTDFGTLYAARRDLAKATTSSKVGGVDALLGLDDRVHPLAPLGVAQPDHHDVGDRRMVDQRRFDLGREHVGTAAEDQVDPAVGQVEVAVVVDVAHVADRGQPVGVDVERAGAEVRRSAVRRRLHVDVAGLAGGQFGAVGSEDADLGAALRQADAAAMLQPLVAAQRGDPECLGHAVGHEDPLGADQLDPALDEARRHRRRTLQDPLDARQVALVDVGQVGDPLEHRRRGGERADAMAFDDVDDRAASNFWRITRWSPPSMFDNVVNPVEWYIGATTRIVCGCGTGPHIAIIGVVNTSWYTAGRLITITFGIPVDPLLQIPISDGDTASGRSSARAVRRSPIARRSNVDRSPCATRRGTPRRRRSRGAVRAPSRAGPTAPGPGRRRASTPPPSTSTSCSEFGIAMPSRSAEAEALIAQRTVRAASDRTVEFAPGERRLGAVGRDVADDDRVGIARRVGARPGPDSSPATVDSRRSWFVLIAGRPSTCSPTMLRWISDVPPAIVIDERADVPVEPALGEHVEMPRIVRCAAAVAVEHEVGSERLERVQRRRWAASEPSSLRIDCWRRLLAAAPIRRPCGSRAGAAPSRRSSACRTSPA